MSTKKKVIALIILIAAITGMVLTGGFFQLIDFLVVRPIVNILFLTYNLVGDFGLAIIIFTILVKLAMFPLVKKQLRQTRLMKKIQPELAQIRKNCKGNKQLESLQTMDLYKRYNVKPAGSLVTLLIQLPIFIAIFGAIRVIATPMPQDNINNRAYDIVAYEGSIIKDLKDKQTAYLADLTNEEIPAEQKTQYDFHPQLFGKVNLDVKASDVMVNFSKSALFILLCAIGAAIVQYLITRQQTPSGKSEKNKGFRDILKEAKAGKEVDQADINAYSTKQMSALMPLMMFFIMFNLHGALAFYYFLSNLLTLIQQKVVLARTRDELDDMTDKTILKELNKIQEAEIVNKKTGTKITRISAKDIKKKRR
ncbi:YidC/Oxa1 family membrane protein insertase [Candidatus Saccharibacteria bacterium]|nr:YidC/Oxa1 family membrane protein insertase [Candidatus Saccharibacteria bacterium]